MHHLLKSGRTSFNGLLGFVSLLNNPGVCPSSSGSTSSILGVTVICPN